MTKKATAPLSHCQEYAHHNPLFEPDRKLTKNQRRVVATSSTQSWTLTRQDALRLRRSSSPSGFAR